MKTHILLLVLLISTNVRGITIAQWTFENNTPADLANSMTIGGIAADVGAGTASARHASAATDWTTPAGNGSANSLSANTWAVGDYFQFQVNTIGFDTITVTWDQAGSSTGTRDFILQYSTDGSSFSSIGSSYQVALSDWVAGSFHNGFTFTPSLVSVAPLVANQANLYFRLAAASTTSIGGGTVSSGGTMRVDNFTVTGTAMTAAVPESGPGFVGLLVIAGLLTFAWRLKLTPSARLNPAFANTPRPSNRNN